MPENRFPIIGTTVPPMLGRAAILQKMMGSLTKATPDHLQVVGPRFSGKTVILHHLAARLRQDGAPYSAILVWDLGHQTPATDEIFMQSLARELSYALKSNHSEYAEHLSATEGNPYGTIAEVLDLLKNEGSKVLAIMDGFDKPLANGRLTRNLWDQLRELALKPSFRLVTASRRTLRDLIRGPEAQTSDFWNIFEPNPVRVGCLDENDLATILAAIPERHLVPGALTELRNSANWNPVLTLGILNTLIDVGTAGTVGPEAIKAASDTAFSTLRDKVDALWSDCAPSSQDLFLRILEEDSISRAGIATTDAEILIDRGFVLASANKLEKPCRLLSKYLGEQPHEGNAIARLFGSSESYQKNLKEVLDRRISQITGIDPDLRHYLKRAIEDLPGHPARLLSNVRGIVDQAFELIWKAELGNKAIPAGWMSIWKHNQERGIDQWQTAFPKGVHRVRLLNLMTGTDRSDSCAKHVTKGTYSLINGVHGFGDFGQHQDGSPIDPGIAYSALHLCIELAGALARELP